MQFYLDTHQLLFASACKTYTLLSSLSPSWKVLSVSEHMAVADSLPQHPCLTLLCFVHGSRFQPWFFWRQAISFCQYVCCFSPASSGTVLGEPHFPRSSVYLCCAVWVGAAWWIAGCNMFPQNLGVSRFFPVAGWEHGTLSLSHVYWMTWTGLLDIRLPYILQMSDQLWYKCAR